MLSCFRPPRPFWAGVLFVLVAAFQLASSAYGQGAGLGPSLGREPRGVGYPSPEYYAALEVYRTGDLEVAMDAFEVAISRTRRDVNGHWIDAIPAYAMMAECQYKRGDLEGAMQSLEVALRTAVRYRGWLRRPRWDGLLQTPAQFSPKQYLWQEANAVNRLPLARSVQFYSGEQITEQRLAQGGRIEELNIKTVDLLEIMKGLAIASYRRRIILGPLAEGDALAEQVLDATKYPAELKLPIARTLIASMRAAERFGALNDEKAISDANKSMLFNGGVHPLSPIAGLSAASALAGGETPKAAIPICLAISNQAAAMDQFEWIGEALQLAAGCVSQTEAAAIQQAAQVAATSLQRESRLASLHCLIVSADAAVTAGDLSSAAQRLEEARSLTSRRDVAQPRLDAYGAYVAARLAAKRNASGSLNAWDEPLTSMLNFVTNSRARRRPLISMPRLFQLQRIRLAIGSNQAGQSADELLALYAADPTIDVWRRDPVDAISGVIADRESLCMARLRIAATRESGMDVLMRLEDLQAGRFRSNLALGGRVHDVHAFSRLPDSLLEKKAVEARNKADKSVRDLRVAATAPLPADASGLEPKVRSMESQAWSIALDRQPIPRVVPHPMDSKNPTRPLPSGVGVLAFCQDGSQFHVVLCTREKATYWAVRGASRVNSQLANLLRGIGGAKGRGARLPEDESWKQDAIAIRDRLIDPGTGPLMEGRFKGIDQLVVIPDGLLWYLPFEILPVDDERSDPLGDSLEITYAASPALAMFPTSNPANNPNVAIAAGRFFAPREPEVNQSIVQSIVDSAAAGATLRLPDDVAVPTSWTGVMAGHVIIAEPTTPNETGMLETPLATYETSLPFGRLKSWLAYPAAMPESVLLSGFRSNLDTNRSVSGAEIAQTIMALQYGGVRDVILSRWAVGGESTATLLREYIQEVPFEGAGPAFERATSILQRTEISPLREPTLLGSDQDRERLTGAQPFFWSTYLRASPVGEPSNQNP
jgi:hypothetical protein